ncbi:MAG: chemotaxis protein CheA, partial [Pirellula sp.]
MANSTVTSRAEFVIESREHLELFERSMLTIESSTRTPVTKSAIDAGLRVIHSLKGNAGFFGFNTIQKLAHAMESALEKHRDGTIKPQGTILESLLRASDRLSAMVEDLEQSEEQDISDLLRSMQKSLAVPIQMKLALPEPPMGLRDFSQTLLSIGAIADVILPKIDLHQASNHWQYDANAIGCSLVSFCSPIQIYGTLKRVGVSVDWQKLGCIHLGNEVNKHGIKQALVGIGTLDYAPALLSDGLPDFPIVWKPETSHSLHIDAMQPITSTFTHSILDAALGSDQALVQSDVHEPDRKANSEVEIARPGNLPVTVDELKASAGSSASFVTPVAPSTIGSDRATTLRIPVDLLDRLINLVSELTLVRNQSLLAFGEMDGIARTVTQRLDAVTSELQETVLKTRMQPVENLFGKFPRMVRDLARQLGKQVELELVGLEVELDKTVLEQLSDPLTHLIRNSIDHGLEPPLQRANLGKPEIGKVTLSATAADGQVIIEIRDDGRGIDPKAIRAKVIAQGLKSEAELQRVSNKDLFSFILLPGFSTANQVSDVSGRGVGMDVVKTNVEGLEGTLTINSELGVGTTMTLRVPLTLAIVPCLIVMVGEQRFAVPQRGLEEIVCIHPGCEVAMEQSFDTELFRLREILLPIVRLSEVLSSPKHFTAENKSRMMDKYSSANRDPHLIEYILVLRSGGKKFGLLVDDVRGTEEVVIKPMHPSMKKIGIFAGATLMGDGRVALIANIDAIAEYADCGGVIPPKVDFSLERDPAEVHRVLLFEYGPNELFAIPLVQVRRIESISMDHVEYIGDHAFVTIGSRATRIIELDQYLGVSKYQPQPDMHLLLPKFVSEPMGILVSRIVDTESLAISLQDASVEDPGILGTAIVGGRLALFIDMQYLRERLF